MEELIINLDEIEKRIKKKYFKIAYWILGIYFILTMVVFKEDRWNLAFFLPLALFLPYVPNLILLKNVPCPYCGKLYFTPFLASKDEMKKLTKLNPACVNCNKKAKVVSEYQGMY